jgi:hypothetical protein
MIIQVILMIIFLYLLNYFVTRNTQILNNRKTDFMRLNDDRLERISHNQKLLDLIYCPEYKYYNPEAYQEIIDYLDAFLELFELIQIDPSKSSDLYQSMVDNKKYIINSLISMSIRLPVEYDIKKFTDEFDKELQKYLIEANYIHEEYLKNNGFDCRTKLIFLNHPDGYNLDDNFVEPGKKLLFNRV